VPLSHPAFSRKGRLVSAAALTAVFIAGPMANAAQAAIQVPLGTASAFSVLAGSTVTNTGPTTISRNVGLAPGTAITGADEMTVAGEYHVADAVALDAKNDLTTAYNQASSAVQEPVTTVATDLGESTPLVGGTYETGGAMELKGQLTLDAQGKADTVWVFRTDSTLITATDSSVSFINGGNPCNVFWQVGSSATLGVRTEFIGTIMASTTITMDTGATLEGRALASTGAVNLHSNRIFGSGCANEEQVTGGTDAPPTAAVTPTATPTATPTTSGSGGGGTTGGSGGGGGTTTTSQIERTPTGSVDTGYAGPVSSSRPALLSSGLTLLTVFGVAALVAVRRRRTM
jgi:hypothetical protein